MNPQTVTVASAGFGTDPDNPKWLLQGNHPKIYVYEYHIHIHIYAYVYVYYIYIYYTFACAYKYVYIYIYTYTYLHLSIYIYTYICCSTWSLKIPMISNPPDFMSSNGRSPSLASPPWTPEIPIYPTDESFPRIFGCVCACSGCGYASWEMFSKATQFLHEKKD